MDAARRIAHDGSRIAGAVLLAVMAGAVFAALGASAYTAENRSHDVRLALEVRVAEARRAASLAPWSQEYRTRYYALAGWLAGRDLLDAGDYSGAVEVLRLAYREDVGEAELLALFQRAQDVEALATTRKAHLQHGHEGPGSTLRPQDVER